MFKRKYSIILSEDNIISKANVRSKIKEGEWKITIVPDKYDYTVMREYNNGEEILSDVKFVRTIPMIDQLFGREVFEIAQSKMEQEQMK